MPKLKGTTAAKRIVAIRVTDEAADAIKEAASFFEHESQTDFIVDCFKTRLLVESCEATEAYAAARRRVSEKAKFLADVRDGNYSDADKRDAGELLNVIRGQLAVAQSRKDALRSLFERIGFDVSEIDAVEREFAERFPIS